jgi:peptide/nickel transport system ATP-binding protein
MYLGKLVEVGAAELVFSAPLHPYSRALVAAAPIPDPVRERARPPVALRGETPSPVERFRGCHFRGRCPLYLRLSADQKKLCEDREPRLDVGPDGHGAACHHTRGAPPP